MSSYPSPCFPQPIPANAGVYRGVSNFNEAWIPSPLLPTRGNGFAWNPPLMCDEKTPLSSNRNNRDGTSKRRRQPCALLRCLQGLVRGHKEEKEDSNPTPKLLPPSDWKAYGYWSRPVVNGVCVHNAARRLIPPVTVDPIRLFNSLRGEHGSPHPERWVPHFEHPSLPPRPAAWRTPTPGEPLPFPWECQLNPFLEHRPVGLTPLTFDIGRAPEGIIWGEPDNVIFMFPEDRSQPATHPFLTHMHIKGVADDMAPQFPWPIMVSNPYGIVCEDVFDAIFDNFQQHVTTDEYESLSSRRKEQVARAYYARVRTSQTMNPNSTPGDNDGLRRIDYMGDRVMFRGLEPSPSRDGTWIMFVGPP